MLSDSSAPNKALEGDVLVAHFFIFFLHSSFFLFFVLFHLFSLGVYVNIFHAEMSVAALAAQMAAGSGDATVEFGGDAGLLRSRDLSATLNAAEDLSKSSGSILNTSAGGGGSKARKALSVVALKDKMVSLRAEVLDTLSLLESMIDDTGNRTKAMHRRMNENHISEIKHIEAFDDGFIHLDTVGFDIPRVMREANLSFDYPFFQRYGMPLRTPSDSLVKKKFLELESKLMVGDEIERHTTEIRRDITKALFPLGDANFPEMLLSLNTFTMTDVVGNVKKDLRNLQDPIDEVTKNLALTMQDLEAAIQDQKMELAESLDLAAIDLCAKRLDLHVKRIGLLCSNEGGGLLASLELVTKNPAVPQMLEEKEKENMTAIADLRKLDADHTEKLKENESTIHKYNNNVTESKRKIRANNALQHQTWLEIERLLEKMADLQREDQALAREHVRMTEVEQKRRQEHREYRESYAIHRLTLEELINNTAAGVAFVKEVQRATEKGKEKIIAAAIEDQIKELLKTERKAYHSVFQAYGTQAGKSLVRYDKKAVAIDQMMTDLHYMRKHANETSDDQGNVYARRINDLEKQQRKARKTYDKLMNDFEARESEFYSLERTFNKAIDDPNDSQGQQCVEMLLRLRAESLNKFVNQIAQLNSSNVAAAEEVKFRQVQLSMDASALRDAVNERRAAARGRDTPSYGDSQGSMGLVTPTRPMSQPASPASTLNISNIEVPEL